MAEHPVVTPAPVLAELAVVVRSGLVESRHLGSLVALGADGTPVLELGDPDAVVLPRSTTKPLQALACLEAGAPLEGPALAIAAGSHTGEDRHVEVVRAVLARAGLDESDLRCPPDLPEDEETRLRLLRAGEGPSRVRMNCSGKHAAMLSACVAAGWPTEGHLDADHPLQQHVRTVVAREIGAPVGHTAVDGCGAALFGTTVRGLATAFRSLALAPSGSPAAQVAAAMRAHPEFVGGRGHVNSRLMADLPGVLAKGGAEGVIGVAGPRGQAVAMKVVDGSPRATTVVALAVLRGLGVDTSAVADLTSVPVLGGGVPVGAVLPGAALAAW
ncbi:asparaginase [Modestobacter sp. Leaf380]|uniref:asparaginase n=1 Tax=Modestobacter sp. Leaf380 TaxID=1736356 RepID=UPI0006F8C6ED|nr:asparaginase [Modestobacter sp. Leaf380]KQS66285.1 asparaginase [Modestobacter sp. Leaf380]